MSLVKTDFKYLFLILIISGILVSDLFINHGRLASFDAPFHITGMAQFYSALKSGDFPVVWTDGIANYGLPFGIIDHQLTNYLGAFVMMLGATPYSAYTIVLFIGVFFSNILFFTLLRKYFSALPSFLAIFLFNFSYYKILNIYIRGALPEVFSNMFLAAVLISEYLLIEKKKMYAFFLLIISITLLTLNHPMMLLIYSTVFGPYAIFLILNSNINSAFSRHPELVSGSHGMPKQVRHDSISMGFNSYFPKILGLLIFAGLLGVGIAAYYILPLSLEIKYFYFGLTKNHLTPDSFLSFSNFINPSWYYFTPSDIFTRGHVIETGLVESIGIIGGIIFLLYCAIRRRWENVYSIWGFAAIVSIIIIFFTISLSSILYQKINILSDIQFPWRMLSALIFIPPILYAAFFTKFQSKIIMLVFVLIITLTTFPQIYGKNYTNYQQDTYFFNPVNVHDVMMNSIWTGISEGYPINRGKVGIINGIGTVTGKNIKNSARMYKVNASGTLRMVDYTFYFPGWNVYVDGQKTNIQYQDPAYRGVITYNVPQGNHNILLKFEDTKVRLLGKMISILSIVIFAGLFFVRFRLKKVIF